MKKVLHLPWLLLLAFVMINVTACKEKAPEAISGFTFLVDAVDFKKVTFTNVSQNYKSVSWDFGDGQTSTEIDPVHTYANLGSFTVTLTATGQEGDTDVSTQTVVIADPNAELTKLVGDASKTWKLIRVVGGGRYPLEVGPIDHSTIWWAMGLNNDDLAKRPCTLNDEFIFSRDGSYEYKSNGDYWAEGGLFEPANVCADINSMVGPNGEDQSAWGDGVHTFTLVNGAKPTLTVTGLGAFVGLQKIGTDLEVKVPQTSVTYDIIKLSDGAVDTLVLESAYKWDPANPSDNAYWRVVLVHYDDPSQEPPIPSPAPVASFTTITHGLDVKFTNNSQYAGSHSWDFGDGQTSTTSAPSHTYAAPGVYKVVYTATNPNGSNSVNQEVMVNATPLTENDLQGAAWKIRPEANSIFVGPGIGSNAWWGVPLNFLDGSTTGTDDWSCIVDDEFLFGPGGIYLYSTKGSARNDGYFGSPNGCWSDAEIAASPGAPFGSGTHAYTFTGSSASANAKLVLTNGSSGAAFIGFYKGFYGGENTNNANAPNGGFLTNTYEVVGYAKTATKEYLFLSVDISDVHDASKSWSVVLER